MSPFTLVQVFLVCLETANAAKILGIFYDLSPSHTMQSRPLFRALAARGHHVTILTGYPDPKPVANYSDILIEGMPQFSKERLHFEKYATDSALDAMINKYTTNGGAYDGIFELVVNANGTKTLLKMEETFDLVFVDLTCMIFALGFVHKFGSPPYIGIIPFGFSMIGDIFAGNLDNPSYVPDIFMPLTDHMSFFERFLNTLEYYLTRRFFFEVNLDYHDSIIRKLFGEGVPPVWEMAKNMSLLMMNTDSAHDYPRPLPPMTIEIGGLHLKPAKKLPKDIKRFIDDASAGVIYFSLGSMLRSDHISAAKLGAVLDTFRALPQRVLWKWESDLPVQNLPPNVLARKWLPQNDILGHPNVKLFITHGGLSSLEEAVYHRVPMVVIPLLSDQFFQAAKIERHGIGVKVDYKTMSSETLLAAVTRILNNASYQSNIARLNLLSRDKINTPLETAIFWTEYVLRHGGAQHLRSAGSFMSWEKYFLIDVISVIVAVGLGLAGISATLFWVLATKMKLHWKIRARTWVHWLVPKSALESVACKVKLLMSAAKRE